MLSSLCFKLQWNSFKDVFHPSSSCFTKFHWIITFYQMLLGASALDYITSVRTGGWVTGRVGFLIKKLSYLWNYLLNEVMVVAVNLQIFAVPKNWTDQQQTSICVWVWGLANWFPHPLPWMFDRQVLFPALPPTHLVTLDASHRTMSLFPGP